jgi:HTH-type transcriptional regulator/antitoxin HigA
MSVLNQQKYSDLYPLKVIRNADDYEAALKSMEAVFDETEGELADYAETLAVLIEKYEDEHYPIKKAHGVDLVKFLMEQNSLKQKDLVGFIGGKSTVSEILSGKRSLNLNHITKLAARFHVSPATFL